MEYKGLLAGLGNPGPGYKGTRHNCGFMFIELLLNKIKENGSVTVINAKKYNALLWQIQSPLLNGPMLVCEPQTFMNNSGQAIAPLLKRYNLEPEDLLVVQDELDLPPGTIRFKFGGGLAGHNGLSSIAQYLGSKDFYRLRIGIGKPLTKEEILKWVLGRPDPADKEEIAKALQNALETFFIFCRRGASAATSFAHAAH